MGTPRRRKSAVTRQGNIYRLPFAAGRAEAAERAARNELQRTIVDVTSRLMTDALRGQITGVFYVIERSDGTFAAHVSGDIGQNFARLSHIASRGIKGLEAPLRERRTLRLVAGS